MSSLNIKVEVNAADAIRALNDLTAAAERAAVAIQKLSVTVETAKPTKRQVSVGEMVRSQADGKATTVNPNEPVRNHSYGTLREYTRKL